MKILKISRARCGYLKALLGCKRFSQKRLQDLLEGPCLGPDLRAWPGAFVRSQWALPDLNREYARG